MKELEIGDVLWHPCNYDVFEHKIIGIRKYEDYIQYETRSARSVGASGRLKLLLSHRESKILFIGYVDGEDSIEYEFGLQDFVEGYYYTEKSDAELVYYENQRTLCWSNMDKKKRLYEEAKDKYDRVGKLVDDIKRIIKERG
jgi:hypothetical protein